MDENLDEVTRFSDGLSEREMPCGSNSVGVGGAPHRGGRGPASLLGPSPPLWGRLLPCLSSAPWCLSASLSNPSTRCLEQGRLPGRHPAGLGRPLSDRRPSRVQCSADAALELSVVVGQRAPREGGSLWSCLEAPGTLGSPRCFEDRRDSVPPHAAHCVPVFPGMGVP